MTMGEKILMLRKNCSWSQEELADRIGVTRQAVSRWESDSAKPDADKIIALCDLFDISADYLLRDRDVVPAYKPEGNGGAESAITSRRVMKWCAWCSLLAGGITMLVLIGIYLDKYGSGNPGLTYVSENGVYFSGFWAYIMANELGSVAILLIAALLWGVIYLALPWIKKLLD